MDWPVIAEEARQLVKMYDVHTPSIMTNVGSLSGGNQQKVIVARELARPVKLLIVNQPTRGLDVGSIEFIHRRIVEARDRGTAVLLISAELDEIMSLSDRIAVMYKGHILDTLEASTATREQLGLLMAGVKEGVHV
jgi:simple sugar transport system ATP-binding protein